MYLNRFRRSFCPGFYSNGGKDDLFSSRFRLLRCASITVTMRKTNMKRCKMIRMIRRSTLRSIVAALLVACVFSLSAPIAVAADGPHDKGAGRELSTSNNVGSPAPAAKAPGVLYAAFKDVMNTPPEPIPEQATRPRSVVKLLESINATAGIPLPGPQQSTVVSTAPMSVGEKFEAWFHSRFLSIGPFGSAIFSGMWKELNDNDDFKKDTVQNYFADSMTRAARSYAAGTTNAFFEKALFASLFRQDPRYHRSGKTSAGGKIGYAVTRVFITQGDRCACHQINASFLLGGAAGAGVATLWERRERTGPMHTISRYYNHIAITALFNVVKEFVGGQ